MRRLLAILIGFGYAKPIFTFGNKRNFEVSAIANIQLTSDYQLKIKVTDPTTTYEETGRNYGYLSLQPGIQASAKLTANLKLNCLFFVEATPSRHANYSDTWQKALHETYEIEWLMYGVGISLEGLLGR